MEHTEGLGRLAEVWVDGQSFWVCDNVSQPGDRCPPGLMERVRFTYVTEEGFTWADAMAGNANRRQYIDHVKAWSYTGYGKILSVMPVVIDFGLLKMADANWTTDERLVGRFVRVAIDRLEVSPALEQDWPDFGVR